jgi:proline iminopeptidase
VLIHGRNDIGGPAITPWETARAWPGSELIVISDSGHTGSAAMRQALDVAAEKIYAAITS